MQISLKPYKRDFKYSYASGVFATLELLHNKPEQVIRVFINSKGRDNKGIPEIKKICAEHRIQVEVADGLVMKLSNSENCYAVGVFNKFDLEIDTNSDHIVLVNPSDMGNIGTIIRNMVGFGVKNLALIRPAVDIFDPKAVRSSTGAFFRINFEYFRDFEEYKTKFSKHNLYPFMLEGSKEISQTEIKAPYSLIFGNEGSGLPKQFERIGQSIKIEHSKEIDSLNLSTATGIALYLIQQKNKN